MRKIEYIVIHCADTYPGMDIGVDEIRQWHLDRGFNDVGYHYVIRRDGTVEKGRDENVIGAHVRGFNSDSIGICLVGGKAHGNGNPVNYTAPQWASLDVVVYDVAGRHPDAEVLGHCDLDSGKTCPNFNVKAWWGA